MIEIWRDIKGFEGKYMVSNLGNVKSLNYRGNTGKEHPLTPRVNNKGRLQVVLYKNGKENNPQVHKLVANTFIPDKTNFKYVNEKDRLKYVGNLDKLEINHKDENPKNNKVDNLEWCTRWYNILYGTGIERHARANMNHPNTSKKVYQYDLDGNLIKIWPSLAEIHRQTGYWWTSISQCCNGKIKTAHNFIWSYKKLTKKEIENILSRASLKSKKVYQYDLNGNFIKEWESAAEIQRQTGYFASAITACCRGERKTAYGYKWRFAN